jgi:N-acetylglucosamine-6-phosphate deacetylase
LTVPPRRLSVHGRLLLGSGLIPGALVLEAGRIAQVLPSARASEAPEPSLRAAIVAPGFIDLQINGAFGLEVGDSADAIRAISARLPSAGVTAWLPTLVSSPAAVYPRAFEAWEAARGASGSRPLGLHLEGPYLSPTRRGAHDAGLLSVADPARLRALLDGHSPALMTLAPELPGAVELVRDLARRGVLVSVGHSDATFEQLDAAVDAGVRMVTHLYNAMSPFHHRAPGVVGAALLDDRVAVGLIADGVHTHPTALELALRAKGPGRVALVTDAMSAAGMADGPYKLGGRTVLMRRGEARLADGTLAGSTLTLDRAVRNMVRWTGASPAEALRMASETPARLLGLTDRGALRPGYVADLALLDEDLRVRATLIGGGLAFGGVPAP